MRGVSLLCTQRARGQNAKVVVAGQVIGFEPPNISDFCTRQGDGWVWRFALRLKDKTGELDCQVGPCVVILFACFHRDADQWRQWRRLFWTQSIKPRCRYTSARGCGCKSICFRTSFSTCYRRLWRTVCKEYVPRMHGSVRV